MPRSPSVRNVAVLGTSDSAVLGVVDSISGREASVAAFDSLIVRRMVHQGHEICFVVVPPTLAHADLALSVTDTALFLVSAAVDAESIDHKLAALWDYCAEKDLARVIVLTDTDAPDADFEDAIMHCQAQFDEVAAIAATHLPLLADDAGVAGLIDLISLVISDYSEGEPQSRQAVPAHVDVVADDRNLLVEAILMEADDFELFESFLSGDTIDAQVLRAQLAINVRRGRLHPVLFQAAAPAGFGRIELLDLLVSACPEPQQRHLPSVTSVDGQNLSPLEGATQESFVGVIVAVESRAAGDYEGELNADVRIFAGEVRTGDVVSIIPADYARNEESPELSEKDTATVAELVQNNDDVSRIPQAGPGEIIGMKLSGSRISARAAVGATLSSAQGPLIASIESAPGALMIAPISLIQ